MNTKVTGQEAYDMMLAIEANKCSVRDHFHWNSPLWRAIRDHIESNECSIILKPDNVMTYSGTGQAIRLVKTLTYHTEYKTDPSSGKMITLVPDFFYMELEIEYYDENHDCTYEKSFILKPPINLLINFTKEGFDDWVKSQSIKTIEEARRNAYKDISNILGKLPPELAKSVLNDLK